MHYFFGSRKNAPGKKSPRKNPPWKIPPRKKPPGNLPPMKKSPRKISPMKKSPQEKIPREKSPPLEKKFLEIREIVGKNSIGKLHPDSNLSADSY